MAIQAQFGGLMHPPYAADEQTRALKDFGVFMSTAAAVTPAAADVGLACGGARYNNNCATQSELTCNNGGGGAAVMPVHSRKRGRENDDELLHYAPFLLPPGRMRRPDTEYSSVATAAMAASTSGRCAAAVPVPATACAEQGVLASELLWRQLHADAAEAEIDALVHAECDRLRGSLEVARERQRRALVRAAVSSGLAWTEAQLEAARRRAAELEERVVLAAAEAQAWCGVARGNEAVARGLQATLDALLLRSATAEGFGESCAEPDDAQSCCCYDVEAEATAAVAATASSSTTWNGKWACKACGEGEASVLVLPCRHLCLCKACEPRMDACPVCSGDKNAALHIAPN